MGRLSTSSASSAHSTTSQSSSTPGGFRLRYARDSKGHDLSSSYPYSSQTSSSASSARSSTTFTNASDDFPASYRDSLARLRYAKDGKGHDFSDAYKQRMVTQDDEQALLKSQVPLTRRDFKKKINRYAKDGKGLDFMASYRY